MTFLFLAPVLLGRPLWPPFDHPLVDVRFCRVCLPSALAGVVFYIHLFAPHVLLDDLPLVDDVFADADLLLRHRFFLDHDLVLDHRHGYFVGAYLSLGRLAAYRHSLDAYLLATGRHLQPLAVGADALADVDATGHALAGPREQFFFAPLHPELVLVLKVATALAEAFLVTVVLAELARFGVAHAHARTHRAGAPRIGGARATVDSVSPPALRLDVPVVDACALSRLRFRVTTLLAGGARRPRGFAVSGRVVVPRGGCRRRAAGFRGPGSLPVCQVHVGVFVVVGAVSAPVRRRWLARCPEVRVNPVLELDSYLCVVVEAGAIFDGVFV